MYMYIILDSYSSRRLIIQTIAKRRFTPGPMSSLRIDCRSTQQSFSPFAMHEIKTENRRYILLDQELEAQALDEASKVYWKGHSVEETTT